MVTNNTPVTVPPGSNVAIMNGNGISRDQAISAARNLMQHGVDPAIVAKAALEHGLDPKDFMTKPATKEAVEAQVREAEVAQGFAPPAEGEKYGLQYDRNFAEASEDPADLAALNADFENGFNAAGVPKALAQPLVDAFLETGEKYADESPSDAAKQMMWKDEGAILRRSVRDLDEHVRLAAIGYNALPKSLREQLDANYALHSARSQIQLEHLGRALEYRAQRKEK